MDKEPIYIAIPKTAGVSIQNSGFIKSNNWVGHKIAREIDNLNNYFSFAFIRNPYEKVLSSYFYWSEKKSDTFVRFSKEYPTFDKFINNYEISTKQEKYHFEYNNWDYVSDGEKIIIDYVGKFDNIEEDFINVQKLCGIQDKKLFTLPKLNNTKHEFWKTYYNDELANIVYDKWAQDFEKFNFDKFSYKLKI